MKYQINVSPEITVLEKTEEYIVLDLSGVRVTVQRGDWSHLFSIAVYNLNGNIEAGTVYRSPANKLVSMRDVHHVVHGLLVKHGRSVYKWRSVLKAIKAGTSYLNETKEA